MKNTTKRNSMKKVSAILGMVMAMSTAASTMAVTASALEVVTPVEGSATEETYCSRSVIDESVNMGVVPAIKFISWDEYVRSLQFEEQKGTDAGTDTSATDQMTADQYIRSLSYDKNTVCTKSVSSTQPETEYRYNSSDGTVTVITRKYESDVKSSSFGISSSVIGKIYPGAIVLAGSGLADGNPTTVSLDRNDCRITVTGLTMKIDPATGKRYSASATFDPSGFSNYQEALNSILANADLSKSQACINYSTEYVTSSEELSAKLNIDSSVIKSLGIEASLNINSSEANLVTVIDQKYFTVSADMQQNGKAFAEGVTGEQLQQAGISSTTPPAMISSADYGRKLIISYSTSDKSIDIQATLKAAYGGTSGQLSTELKEKLSKIKANVYMYGGSSSAQSKFIGQMDASKINEIIQDTANMDSISDGALTNYSANYLQGGETAVRNDATSCTVATATKLKSIPIDFRVEGVNGRIDDFHFTATYDSYPIPKDSPLAKELKAAGYSSTTNADGDYIFSGKLEDTAKSNTYNTHSIPAWANPKSIHIKAGYNGTGSSANHNSLIDYYCSNYNGTITSFKLSTESSTKWWGGYRTNINFDINGSRQVRGEG